MQLMVSIDTECDCSQTWNLSSPLTFRGVTVGIRDILQPLFDKHALFPVYFLSHEVIEDTESLECLKEISGRCELASHLHVGFIDPEKRTDEMAGAVRYEMQYKCSREVEYAKLENLTKLFVECFGVQPISFRAGRYGASHATGAILMKLGYKVDSSVTPHIRWRDHYVGEGPNFIGLREQPYRVSEQGDIWQVGKGALIEIPITVRRYRRRLSRFWRPNLRWFRPWYTKKEDLQSMIDTELRVEQKTGKEHLLVMMFHNMEVIPGASPYPKTEADVASYVDALDSVLTHAEKCGIRFTTMKDFYLEKNSLI